MHNEAAFGGRFSAASNRFRKVALPTRLCATTLLGLAAAYSAATLAAPVTYDMDPAHTYPSFEADHLGGLSILRGKFKRTTGSIVWDRGQRVGSVRLVVDATSISFGHSKLNEHAMSADMFDTAKYPDIKFSGTFAGFSGETPTEVSGTLTMHGVTRPVTLTINRLLCKEHPMRKKEVCGADASAAIDRADFGISYGQAFGFDQRVRLLISIEAVATEAVQTFTMQYERARGAPTLSDGATRVVRSNQTNPASESSGRGDPAADDSAEDAADSAPAENLLVSIAKGVADAYSQSKGVDTSLSPAAQMQQGQREQQEEQAVRYEQYRQADAENTRRFLEGSQQRQNGQQPGDGPVNGEQSGAPGSNNAGVSQGVLTGDGASAEAQQCVRFWHTGRSSGLGEVWVYQNKCERVFDIRKVCPGAAPAADMMTPTRQNDHFALANCKNPGSLRVHIDNVRPARP